MALHLAFLAGFSFAIASVDGCAFAAHPPLRERF